MTNVTASETNVIPSEVALLPCPWCGKDDKLTMHARKTRHYDEPLEAVMCTRCGTRGRYQLTEKRATAAWNTRPLDAESEMAQRIQSLELECAKLQDELRKAGNRGTLTAEQVRTAIFNGSSYASYDGAKYYADGIGMQAITDELNATLGGGECEMEYATEGMKRGWWVCSECGEASDTIESCAGRKPPNYCGNCGKAVKR